MVGKYTVNIFNLKIQLPIHQISFGIRSKHVDLTEISNCWVILIRDWARGKSVLKSAIFVDRMLNYQMDVEDRPAATK